MPTSQRTVAALTGLGIAVGPAEPVRPRPGSRSGVGTRTGRPELGVDSGSLRTRSSMGSTRTRRPSRPSPLRARTSRGSLRVRASMSARVRPGQPAVAGCGGCRRRTSPGWTVGLLEELPVLEVCSMNRRRSQSVFRRWSAPVAPAGWSVTGNQSRENICWRVRENFTGRPAAAGPPSASTAGRAQPPSAERAADMR